MTNRSITRLALVLSIILASAVQAQEAAIEVQADRTSHALSRLLTGACIEDVNHEIYGGIYSQMIFGEGFQEPPRAAFQLAGEPAEVSGQWTAAKNGDVRASFNLVTNDPFVGIQSQRLEFKNGKGEVSLANKGLNGWGLNFVAEKPYQGCIWARSEQQTDCFVALEDGDGKAVSSELQLTVTNHDWQRFDFTLTPHTSVERGRFSIKLKQAGAITVGYAFLQPGEWGRFKGLPVRRDVAEGLMDQGITVLRYGGSMVNAAEYRWKKMMGPRDRRAPYRGTWYPYSSNGWGILDFLNFCEAAGFVGIPDFNSHETPQDMADFIEYVNGPANSVWGAQRAADGHPQPYGLKYLELGNEERVDETYANLFEALAKAIWAKDPDIILVVGDFAYENLIEDPFQFTGADSKITSLAAQQRILQLAKSHHREVWFDVHVWTDGPRPTSSLQGAISFRNALEKISDGAAFKVAIFELNANNHSQRRALANALAVESFERDGRIPIVTSANGLQPDGQNDNGWDQGLLFLNPSQVWLQPPGYVTQMLSRNYQPRAVECQVTDPAGRLEANAKRSEDGQTLVLQVVNISPQPTLAALGLNGFAPVNQTAHVEELDGDLDSQNSPGEMWHIKPRFIDWKHETRAGRTTYSFPANSFTLIKFN